MTLTNITAGMPLVCWHCQCRDEHGHFCVHCGKIQPVPSGADYFTLLGLPPKLQIDATELEQRFLQLSWKLHPDRFTQADEKERALSLERSAQLNDAYRALHEPVSRVEYLLRHRGVRKEGTTKQKAPPELLEEVFELNESLDELRSARKAGDDDLPGLKQKLETAAKHFEEKLGEVDGELFAVFAEWDAALESRAGDAEQRKLMSRMNEILNRRSYIRNLVSNVQQELVEEA